MYLNITVLLIKFIIMKISFKSFGILSIAGVLTLAACNNNTPDSASAGTDSARNTMSQDDGTVDSASTRTDGESATTGTMITNANPEQATIDYMVPDNKKEMAWLMAGISKGTSKEVKDHARKMLADHKKLGQQVADFIKTKNLTEPTVDTANVVNLTEEKGKEWDKAWVNKMVQDHSDLLNKLNLSESEVRDSSLKKLVINTKPVVQSHLDMSKMMQDKMK